MAGVAASQEIGEITTENVTGMVLTGEKNIKNQVIEIL